MKIALFGAGGQVGEEAIAAAPEFPALQILPLRRSDANLSQPGAAASVICKLKPAAVINAAAWTAVDKAESQPETAHRINALAAGEIADACRAVSARLVHISTDYVFSGEAAGAALAEDSPIGPVNAYGASKLRGEELARAGNPDTVVLRTSWVYSVHGGNFVKTMLRLAETKEEISVVDDQIGGPTPASAIARACLSIAARREGPVGVYHYQGAPEASWADFAEAIFAAGGRRVKVNRIASSQYPTPAKRPLYTVLNCSKIERDYGIRQPDWLSDIAQTVARLEKLKLGQ